ncbi:MAG: hypothetical protein WC312_05360, partial [Candidatus Omnitrophota bacterium]
EKEEFTFAISPYFRTDAVAMKNTVDLDSNNKDDSTVYLGIDYSLDLDLKFKDDGPEAYIKLERNGPSDYNAPLFTHNTLINSSGRVDNYQDRELLPHIEEFWYDFPLYSLPSRAKAGLFVYEAGNNIAVPAYYENYSLSLYGGKEDLKWKFYYCRPDLVNRSFLGPRIEQEREQGISYQSNKANFFAADVILERGKNSFQPYIEILSDNSGDSRARVFSTPTNKDLLGTAGLAWNLLLDKLSVKAEGAMNFGKAKSSDPAFKDVEHRGYLLYGDVSYDLGRMIPHSRFTYASGNKVTTEMADNGDTELTSGKNRAFSAYSPMNTNLWDSLGPNQEFLPLVAMGNGWGLNYGVSRPTTLGDPGLFENLILFDIGFDYQLTDKLSFTFDWWYLRAAEEGVGVFETVSKKLSPELGNEVDLYFEYELNENVIISLYSGYFFPGRYYKEKRDDTDGSIFTPFVRGDGEADGAYQIEASLAVEF